MTGGQRRLRVGIDTGGTFTDVVVYDEESGQLSATKTPTTPADPSIGFIDGLTKVLAGIGVDAESAGHGAVTALSHGTTIATNQLLEGKIGRLGFITTEGFEFMLEIARQSVPDGYGNSYFWVKPPRIVPAHLVKTVAGRIDHTGAELRPFPQPVMEASYNAANETYAEISRTNAPFRKMLDSLTAYRSDSYQWLQVAELTYDSFMIRMRTRT